MTTFLRSQLADSTRVRLPLFLGFGHSAALVHPAVWDGSDQQLAFTEEPRIWQLAVAPKPQAGMNNQGRLLELPAVAAMRKNAGLPPSAK